MIDHDQLFKKLLREFVAAFLPAVAAYLDPSEITFLDKELFTRLNPGKKRSADLVARVKFKGRAAYFLLHCEPESSRRQRRGAFGDRLFDYFALLRLEHHLPIYPVALLTYDQPHNAEDDVFRIEFPDKTVLEFHFTVIQLNRLNWRDFLKTDNPVAAALMAKMGFAPEERVEVKKECLRMIVRLRYDRERTKFLAEFVDIYLELTAEEEKQFSAEIEKLPHEEQEQTMEIITSWERRGRQQGLEQGLEQGLQQGLQEALERERQFVLRILISRIGAISKSAQSTIAQLPVEQLEDLGIAALNFNNSSDLTRWLREHTASNGKTNGTESNGTHKAKKR